MQSTFSYSYDDASWGDLLTTVGDDDVAYDEIGNPTYIGYTSDGEIFDSAYELIWEGRQLVTHRYREYYYEDDIEYFDEVNYTYNADGIRTSKTVEGIKHEYILNGSQIIAETWTESGVEYVLFYFYDEAGAPLGIKYRTSNYAANDYDYFYFEKNLQGDIVAIYNESGTQIGRYYYDAWGNFTTYSFGSTGLERYIVEDYNPFRYRGYYYDVETGYYYLQSRYYNPNWGRFLNADGQLNPGLLGSNMFAYCNNNPVMGTDETGRGWLGALIGGVCGAVVGATYGVLNALISGSDMAATVVEYAVIGGLTGAVAGCLAENVATLGTTSVGTATLIVGVSSFVIGTGVDLATQCIENLTSDNSASIDWKRAFQTGVEAGSAAAFSMVLPWGSVLENVVLTTIYDATVSTVQFGIHGIQEIVKQQKGALDDPGEEPIPIY